MNDLERALEQATPAIREALASAQRELEQLATRKRALEAQVAQAKVMLGEPTKPLTLHAALELILRENDNEPMDVKDLARIVNERALYTKRDGSRVEANQIHARTKKYDELFDKDGARVRLKE